MKLRINILSLFLSFLLIFTLCSCDGASEAASPEDALKSIMTEEEIDRLSVFADGIEPSYKGEMSAVYYIHVKESADKLSQVGTKGTAFLISELDRFTGRDDEYLRKGFFSAVTLAIWRTSPKAVRGAAWQYFDQKEHYNEFEKECIVGFYKQANKRIPKIIATNESLDLKLDKLKTYGIISIPFIVDEINRGHSEYARYFIEIGLHLSTPEFMEFFGDLLLSDEEKREKIVNHPKAEDFDYKVWLSENEEDLNNLFKFLDAYCKEYEAEMAKG